MSDVAWSRLRLEPAAISEIAVDREVFRVLPGVLTARTQRKSGYENELSNEFITTMRCVICHEQYVSQIKNKFSKTWSSHRSNWIRLNCKNDKDEVALSRH